MAKLPVAWLQLKYDFRRTFVAVSGIVFAVVMIFMQLGFRAALFDSAVNLHESWEGDIFLVSPRSTSLTAMERFPQRRLDQTLAFDAVDFVTPVYLGFAQWKNPQTRNYWRPIYVIGFEIKENVFNLPGVTRNLEKLKLPDVILFDRASRDEFGPVAVNFEQGEPVVTEVGNRGGANRQVTVAGLFNLGPSFGADGNLITSHLNFLRIFSNRQHGLIEVGIIKLNSGAPVDKTVEEIRRALPEDINVLSKKDFIQFEKTYWHSSTSIGFVFNLSVVMAIIVGIVVVYQILYTNVNDYLPEYATLKAMGYPHQYLLSLVFQEAIILATLGYAQGIVIALISYHFSKEATSLPIEMTLLRAVSVLILTGGMCCIAGVIAIQKLQDADPADVF